MDNDTDIEFLTKVSMFVSQIKDEENLKELFIASFGMIKEHPNNNADDYLDTIIKVAENNNFLN